MTFLKKQIDKKYFCLASRGFAGLFGIAVVKNIIVVSELSIPGEYIG